LHIWDTLGQEKFKSVAPLFFRKAVGAFLVYDCTNKASFDHLKSWFDDIVNNIDTRVIIMLIGNKCDLPNREVSYNMAMDYARHNNFGFLEVSAKTGTNVNSSFNCLVRGNR
jgi:Ras-related protein Rab-2A